VTGFEKRATLCIFRFLMFCNSTTNLEKEVILGTVQVLTLKQPVSAHAKRLSSFGFRVVCLCSIAVS